ncbi:MAG: 50S ribosomal protein L30 [Acidobacteriota bacterium]
MARKIRQSESGKILRIQQIRSGIGCTRQMRETLKALGLGRMRRVSERQDTRETRGMIAKINHLVQVVDQD